MEKLNDIYSAIYDEFLALVNGDDNMMVTTIGTSKVTCEEVVYAIEEILGIEVDEKAFNWESDALSEFAFYSFRVGVTTIAITRGKSLMGLLCEIMAALLDGMTVKRQVSMYLSSICNDGCGVVYEFDFERINSMDIKELISSINEDQYCNSEWTESIIEKLGYKICEGEHPELGLCKYIDTTMHREGSKIWLNVGVNQHTLYSEVKPRLFIEVLYLLHSLYFDENIFSDEY